MNVLAQQELISETQGWWLIVELGIIALVMLVTLLDGYRRRGPRP